MGREDNSMALNDLIFCFCFLPLCLLVYYLFQKKLLIYRKYILLLISLFFMSVVHQNMLFC